MTEKWHTQSTDEVLRLLGSSHNGLTETEVNARLTRYGANELKGKKKTSPAIVFLKQFLSPLIYVLVAAAVISMVVGHFIDAWVIIGVLLANAVVGFTQEIRAEKAMEALNRLAAPKAKVRRDGVIKQLPAREIVPGDIIFFETGDKVPTDARLIETSNLKINESPLTGESMPVEKNAHGVAEDVPISDRKNIAYMGTIITYGRATAVATVTGMSTEIGKIADAIQDVKPEPTPLQKSISKLSKYIIFLVLGLLVILVVAGVLRGLEWFDLFLVAVAAAVSAIPEGLPAVVTIVLALGMRTMARRNAIIRKLVAVETLGSATVICSDKTGTLTLNQMTVRSIFVNGHWIEVTGEGYEPKGCFQENKQNINLNEHEALNMHLRIGTLCNDALLTSNDGNSTIYGDPTEGALVVAAAKAGMVKEILEQYHPRIAEIPFQSEKQYMATLHSESNGRMIYMKGSVEKILAFSRSIMKNNQVVPITEADKKATLHAASVMGKQTLRVMATAYLDVSTDFEALTEDYIKGKMVFAGLSGMADPPREEAKEAIRLCLKAGIRVVMITGDHKDTAESVASQLNMPPGKVVTGTELQQMSDEELSRDINNIQVFARIEPLHKLRIVNALKSRGHTVAMTGDGVNDAPALKSANIGIAMGITGTDIAKEASDMVLADDNFASVVAAVEEGRSIFQRLRNVIFFLLGTNIGELIALTLSVTILGKAPLLAVQIIWINLVTDTAVGIPMGLEPKVGDELNNPPRHPKVGLIFPGLLVRVAVMAGLMGIGVFLIFNWAQRTMSLEEARSVAFCSMVVFEWFRAFNARSDEIPLLKLGIFRNRTLIYSISTAILLQMAVIYLPFMQVAFGTRPLGLTEWGIAVLAGGSLFLLEEIRKHFFPKLFSFGKWEPVGKGK
ncbi:MAG: HAD-IC family P-type ATPase [Dehalococcoidales bacterium]|nr:HAD-IC family P-type ATPase [Dehalococcoidales bacterium]